MGPTPKSANMVRRESFLARRKALQAEIDVRAAQVAKIDGQIEAVTAAIEREATVVRATIATPDVLRAMGVKPGA